MIHSLSHDVSQDAQRRLTSLPVQNRQDECRSPFGNYFVAAYPPFSSWSGNELLQIHDALDDPSAGTHHGRYGLYVHIPFCLKRCPFCYYLSYDNRGDQIDRYLASVIHEASQYRRTTAIGRTMPGSIYFGGGTPSLLSTARIKTLLTGLQNHIGWNAASEITFECAPKTVTRDKMELLRQQGITRISLGVQQLNDHVLNENGRVHLVEDVLRAYELICAEQFEEVNVDLITGLVGETEETFFDSLRDTINLVPDSVTIYQLEIPHNTALYRAAKRWPDLIDPPTWDVKGDRLDEAFTCLEHAGYHRISAYTCVREPARHGFAYMRRQYRGGNVLGLGASSFSYIGGVHYQNHPSLGNYLHAVNRHELPISRGHILSDDERAVRNFILHLKLGRVNRQHFESEFGHDPVVLFAEPLGRLLCDGHARTDAEWIHLTSSGLVHVDRLIPQFYLPIHDSSNS